MSSPGLPFSILRVTVYDSPARSRADAIILNQTIQQSTFF